MTEDQPSPIVNEEISTHGRNFSPSNHETSSAAEIQRKNLKDADVQVMIDPALGKANEAQNSEDEVLLLKLKLEEVKRSLSA